MPQNEGSCPTQTQAWFLNVRQECPRRCCPKHHLFGLLHAFEARLGIEKATTEALKKPKPLHPKSLESLKPQNLKAHNPMPRM